MEELSKALSDFVKLQQEQSQAQHLAMAKTQQEFMERVATTLAGNAEQHHGQPRTDAEFRMEALGQSISEFDYTPESDITFDAWYGRYESLFSEDAVHLTEQEKTRLLLRKLNTRCHQIYINSILPQLPKDKSFIDTVTLLKSIFGRRESLFSTRYRCLQLNKSDLDDYNAYAAQVNKLCEEFKLAELTGDQFKCLMFVCGLQSHQYADIRTKILSAIDGPNAANVTLQNLVAECHRISNLKSDTAMVETHSVKAIQDRSANHQNKPKQHQATNNPQNTKQKISKRPCWFCGEMHFSRYSKRIFVRNAISRVTKKAIVKARITIMTLQRPHIQRLHGSIKYAANIINTSTLVSTTLIVYYKSTPARTSHSSVSRCGTKLEHQIVNHAAKQFVTHPVMHWKSFPK